MQALIGIDKDAVTPPDADQGAAEGASRPALVRRHRHLHQGRRRRAKPMSATTPMTRCASMAARSRAKVVGEGANLGVTQLGRIEFARRPAGASTPTPSTIPPASTPPTTRSTQDPARPSAIARGDTDRPASATQLLAEHDRRGRRRWCCEDNYDQTGCITHRASERAADLDSHERFIQRLEARAALDRRVEGLPLTSEFAALGRRSWG